jgi:predicted nucleotidyltransferase
MRISAEQQQIIVDAVHQLFGQQGSVRLFGSRVDDQHKGGDLDLLVELPHLPVDAHWQAARLEARLQQLLGEQKIDVILAGPENASLPIVQEASRTGIPL